MVKIIVTSNDTGEILFHGECADPHCAAELASGLTRQIDVDGEKMYPRVHVSITYDIDRSFEW